MKPTIIYACFVALVAMHCKSKTQKDAQSYMDAVEQTMKENSPDKKDVSFPAPSAADVKDILGSWELKYLAQDHNHNKMLDDNERQDADTNMKDFFQFNADGSCLVTIGQGEAHYKIENKDGQKIIWLYDNSNQPYSHYTLVSRTEDELVLYTYSMGLFVYKKV